MLVLLAALAQAQTCTPLDLATSVDTAHETVRAKVLGQVSLGADDGYRVQLKNTFDGCIDPGQVAYVKTSTDPAACGATLTVGDTYVLTARYEQHLGGTPVLRIGTTTAQLEQSTLTTPERDLLLTRERTCRRDWWVPTPGTTWQWQLTGAIDTSVDVEAYDIDLFDVNVTTIDQLHADGRTVICYFSAGSWEDWRADAADFPAGALGNNLSGWPGEKWLDVRDPGVRSVMEARLDEAVSKGCDAVEPDNVDGYTNGSGFPLTRADQLDYNEFLANAAHARGLSVGLKNALGLVDDLHEAFDWSLNEECVSYSECAALDPFIDDHKAVFHTEYVNTTGAGPAAQATVCADPSVAEFSTLIKRWDLDAWALTCP